MEGMTLNEFVVKVLSEKMIEELRDPMLFRKRIKRLTARMQRMLLFWDYLNNLPLHTKLSSFDRFYMGAAAVGQGALAIVRPRIKLKTQIRKF